MNTENNNEEKKVYVEKRKGPNFWVKFVKFFSIFDWILIAAILFILDSAMPKKETFFDRIFNINRYDIWDFEDLKTILLFLIIFLFHMLNLQCY